MSHSRIERRAAKAKKHRKNALAAGSVMLGVATLIAIGALILHPGSGSSAQPPSRPAQTSESAEPATNEALSSATPSLLASGGSAESVSTSSSTGADDYLSYSPAPMSTDATPVEVPNVVGRTLSDARMLLSTAGLTPECAAQTGDETASVTSQRPEAGIIATAGSPVALTLASRRGTAVKAQAAPKLVVCIDPGHQSHSNSAKEPVGPGSKTLKAKVTGGATGIKTRVPEYEVALQIAMNVRARLRKAGVTVVMTRTTNDVNLSNAQRAQIANRAKASLFLRIHANGSGDARTAGASTLFPGTTRWTKSTASASRRAATLVQRGVLASTSAVNDGLHARNDLAGFNWCTRPAILVECGYLSNPIEDRLLTSPKYQDKVAAGIAAGVLRFLGR